MSARKEWEEFPPTLALPLAAVYVEKCTEAYGKKKITSVIMCF
jgi:hypothetical protein